jgi:hypothetical protein
MFGIPTLFIPNMDTGMDDQVARCRIAEEEGWGLVNLEESKISDCINSLLKLSPAKPSQSVNGTQEVSKLVLNSSKPLSKGEIKNGGD